MSIEERDSENGSDTQLQELLRDAYDVPAVPSSLQQRLRVGVEKEFGIQLHENDDGRPAIAGVIGGAIRKLRSWPVAASLALVVCGWFMLRGDSAAYGWSAMIEALQSVDSEVFQLQRTSQSGQSKLQWVSLSRGVVGESFDETTRIWDHRRGVVTVRRGDQVRRASFGRGNLNPDPQRLLLAVMLDRNDDLSVLEDVKAVDEGWSETDDGIELKVSVGSDGAGQIFTFVVDADSSLPRSFQSDDSAKVTYPDISASQMIVSSIPPELPVRDVDLAKLDDGSDGDAGAKSSANDLATDIQFDGDSEPRLPAFGAASLGWTAVEKPGLSDEALIEQLDALMDRLWIEHEVTPTAPASDEEIVRRVYLDLVGRTPTVAELREYNDAPAQGRYQRLVDRLLASRDHATHVAAVWRSFLLPEGVDLSRFGGTESFDRWMAEKLLAGRGYDEIVRELLLAEGRLTLSGPLLFYAASKLDADKLAARSARVFLGMRLECAQCHDDPFEPYTQEDFWSYAAFFARISRPQAALETVSTVMRVRDIDRGEVMLPETEDVVEPRFLDMATFDQSQQAASRRKQLAQWMTAPGNPFFARATANRVWAHMFGLGIVNPVDGFGEMNEPKSQELLDSLSGYLVESNFDLRAVFRAIALSRAYRLSSGAESVDAKRHEWFAQMNVKTLTAEQVYDCITVATMLTAGGTEDGFNLSRVGNTSRDQFISLFRTPAGRTTEYHGGIPQALTLMNGSLIQGATGLSTSGLLKTLDAPFLSDDQRIEVLYMATLSRKPSQSEWQTLKAYVAEASEAKEAYADILWTLLNSAEFTMNH